MSDDATTADAVADDGAVDEGAPKKKGMSGKKLILFVVLPVLLLAGGGAGVFFSGLLDSPPPPLEGEEGGEGQAAANGGGDPAELAAAIYYDVPDLLVNLNTGAEGQAFLRLTVSLELTGNDARGLIENIEPRIVDSFQVYLRELRVEDLSGSAGMQRLREELLLRVNAAAQSHVVKDVLFKEMLVQ